jgi:3-(3-hydroxy-phenyl)propionate hydroxylase
MASPHIRPTFGYRRSADQDAAAPVRHPVVLVGAGPAGLSVAIDLALQHVPVVLLDDDDTVSGGSRAVCYAKRTLEVWDRLGVGDAVVADGVGWRRGWVHHGDRLVYEFDLMTEAGHKMPAFTNLQQYLLEEALVARARQLAGLDLRWRNRLISMRAAADHVALRVDTPDGPYDLECQWLVATDGARSLVRRLFDLEFIGQTVRDRFLICDVETDAAFPNLRHFWFDPPFHRERVVLLHRQAANLWRIDFQLGWYADPAAEQQPERVAMRLRRILGERAEFRVEAAEVYTFQCRRLERFVHGRVVFAGDAAHQVSPFGARGANSGVQDADNLAWKLRLVLAGLAPAALLESYDRERVAAADENLCYAARAAEFISPRSPMTRALRDAALHLAGRFSFARDFINSGRLSEPAVYTESLLTTPDDPADRFAGGVIPGAACLDAPVERQGQVDWLLHQLGFDFVALVFAGEQAPPSDQVAQLAALPVPVRTVVVRTAAAAAVDAGGLADTEGLARDRYDGRPGTTYLVRPDQHVAARWRRFDPAAITVALARATGLQAAA